MCSKLFPCHEWGKKGASNKTSFVIFSWYYVYNGESVLPKLSVKWEVTQIIISFQILHYHVCMLWAEFIEVDFLQPDVLPVINPYLFHSKVIFPVGQTLLLSGIESETIKLRCKFLNHTDMSVSLVCICLCIHTCIYLYNFH